MNNESNHRSAAARFATLAVLVAALVTAAFGGTALAAESPPENTALPTVSPTQPYVDQKVSGLKGTWSGSPTSYKLAWNRCDFNGKCEPISATINYTPVLADLNRKLSLSVTATNAYGSTTATSAETQATGQSLSWYRCKHTSPGTGVFNDPGCSEEGGSASYYWVRATGSKLITEQTSSFVLRFAWPGFAPMEINCAQSDGEGDLVNAAARAELEQYELDLNYCGVTLPAGEGCKIPGEKLELSTLKGQAPASPEALKPEMNLVPSAGGSFLTSFEIEGCSYSLWNSKYEVSGSLPMTVNNENSTMTINSGELGEHINVYRGGLKLPGWVTLNSSMLEVFGGGSQSAPVKLDVGP